MRNYRVLDDKFWVDALDNTEIAHEVLRLFYSHTLNLSCISEGMSLDVLSEEQVCKILIRVLMKYSCQEIIDILSVGFKTFEINKSDICQYSSFNDCYYKVIDLTIRSGIEGITWDKMGFLLRVKPRTKIADQKYGENHGKTAVQMGLCKMDQQHHFWPTTFGLNFNSMGDNDKELLKPRLCLYIPIIQNYFVSGHGEDLLKKYYSLLSESTKNRRQPNINRIINIVKSALQ